MKRNKFSLSHYKNFTAKMGQLVPCGLMEVLPGDSFQQSTSLLVRCAPMVAPPMHPVRINCYHFFVPHRIIWEDWEDFITGGPDGNDASVFPTITMPSVGGAAIGSLADYLGIPTAVNSLEVSALPFRAYALIWNEWFRDQDLMTELVIDDTSGPDTTTNTTLQYAAWEKDYFTSSRPWEQKGPSITIPIGTTAPVHGLYTSSGNTQVKTGLQPVFNSDTSSSVSPTNMYVGSKSASGTAVATAYNATNANVFADLTGASAVTVNALREALALQRYEEARARFGSRYTEYLRYLGVRSSDSRLQRPEFLGGGAQTVQFSEVLTTANTADGTTADLYGHGIGYARSNRYRRFFEEHGYIVTLAVVRPKTVYENGLFRTWNRRTKEDFWQKELEHIGQQAVLNKEVYAANANPNDTFGYQDRYDEYRYMESSVHGQFRSIYNMWHFARNFGSSPALNSDFVKCVPSVLPFGDQTNDNLLVMVKHNVQARRLLAKSGSSFIL